uniref:Uncharacterized protein n=1 Tax=Papilio xuthus TaxID=66420 RepID=I4DJE9_PAPXU|nr:unknown unsecreted protein [Papilio xuthus]
MSSVCPYKIISPHAHGRFFNAALKWRFRLSSHERFKITLVPFADSSKCNTAR